MEQSLNDVLGREFVFDLTMVCGLVAGLVCCIVCRNITATKKEKIFWELACTVGTFGALQILSAMHIDSVLMLFGTCALCVVLGFAVGRISVIAGWMRPDK